MLPLEPGSRSPRVDCVACRRPSDRCICGRVGRVDNRTGVTILQHPGERNHPFNTARLARAALRRVELCIVWPDAEGRLVHPGTVPEGAALLYPRHDARLLDAMPVDERPRHLVVLDGTWPQARGVYRDNPWLEALPHVQLSPKEPSRYRIRREPAPHCVSTLESIALALAVLEPEAEGLPRLLDGFYALVDTQADQSVARARRSKQRTRPSVIERLRDEWDRVVVGYAETVGVSGRGSAPVLVQWAAVRPSTGDVFSAHLAVAQTLTERQQRHTGYDPVRAESVEAFRARWEGFAGYDPLLTCWSPRAVPLLEALTGRSVDAISLRSAYGNIRRGALGYLDQVTAREGTVAELLDVSGRAADRLGHAVALARWLSCWRPEVKVHPLRPA